MKRSRHGENPESNRYIDLEVGSLNSYMERPESATIKYCSLFQAPGLSTGASPSSFKIIDSSKTVLLFWLTVLAVCPDSSVVRASASGTGRS